MLPFLRENMNLARGLVCNTVFLSTDIHHYRFTIARDH